MSITIEVIDLTQPEPNSSEMVTLLHEVIMEALSGIPYRFSNGDLMGAALHIVVDVGLENAPASAVREDVTNALDEIVAHRAAQAAPKN